MPKAKTVTIYHAELVKLKAALLQTDGVDDVKSAHDLSTHQLQHLLHLRKVVEDLLLDVDV